MMKRINIFFSIAALLFILLLCGFLSFSLIFPPLLVTYEYAHDIKCIAVSIAIYIGGSTFLTQINFENLHYQISRKIKKPRGRKPKKRVIFSKNFLIFSFISIFMGAFSYLMLLSMPASYLHANAPKEYIEIEAEFSSAWPARKDIRNGCQYHLLFDTPSISPNVQSVCLSRSQWPFYRDLDFNKGIKITLYGEKSYYGYELRCCK